MSILNDELTNDPNAVDYSAMTDEQAANSLNAKTIASKQPISSHDIKAYLNVVDKRLAIIDSVEIAARKATLALNDFESFDVNNPAYLNKLTSVLDGLVTSGLISATDKANILAMGDTTISRADDLGITVTTGLVQAAKAI